MINMFPLWMSFSFKDVIDIVLVALFLFYTYQILKSSGSKAIFLGIFTFLILWVLVSQLLEMKLMGAILDKFVNVGTLLIIIIFQDEIRKFLVGLGSTRKWRFVRQWFSRDNRKGEIEERKYIAPVILAAMNLSKKRTGAIIVISQSMDLSNYIHTGEMFRSEVNARLIENIFFKNSPLHDGAMIIMDGKICAAGCILPVSSSEDLNKDLGLRHRSALGISQETDAKVVIVSEERGFISYAHRGEIHENISVDELRKALEE
ncbi:diadenylate cyclase CdaA [Porphyromonas circumdentaria]|nr:uncharacterized protein (TIGR00159 family) [Porphyromonas circumdentaria]